jgi:hypothetical protein
MMNALAPVIRSRSALFSSGVSNIYAWSMLVLPSPNGRPSVWLRPAK